MATRDVPDPPAHAELEGLLAGAWPAWRALLDGQPELRPEWKYYGAKYGWSLKLFSGKRNMCFIAPGAGQFTVGFLFGANDTQRVLSSDVPQALKDELADAREYIEGRAVRVVVARHEDLKPVLQLLAIKRAPRRPPLEAQ
jgi:hypothetical protein